MATRAPQGHRGDPFSERARIAGQRFAAFFGEIRERFVERDDLVTQIALGLLAREHVLVTGPPGTGKSALVAATLGRIVHEGSGEPSLFAKQFTESTVQTELIGPVDFRTLTETGRMEHFTDEGMLGAVHAFLDEVLDGRDMLLRSTLNILEERELKQGTTITRGLIECAVMTSNRYLAEVLEESRVTLLAFVDRIAFVGFVPRGFAHPERLNALVAATLDSRRELVQRLTVEDVDELQDQVDQVVVPRPVLEAAVELGRSFDERTSQLERADPTFSATRYFSTRAYIRLAKLLRVIVVYDRAVREPSRPLVATHDDLGALRLSLMLAGPDPEDVERLLEVEADPRERRQLELMRAELDIFRECLRSLPAPEPVAVVEVAPEEAGAHEGDADPGATTAGKPVAELAPLSDAVLALASRPGDLAAIQEVADIADRLERVLPGEREVYRRARGRASEALAEALAFGSLGEPHARGLSPQSELTEWMASFETHLGMVEAATDLRTRLHAAGVAGYSREDEEEHFAAARARLEEHLATLTDLWAHASVRGSAEVPAGERLRHVTGALGPVVSRLRPFEDRVRALTGGDAPRVARCTLGRRVAPLLRATYAGLEQPRRERLVEQVAEALEVLGRLSLADDVPRDEHLGWIVEALIRGDRSASAVEGVGLGQYRALRGVARMPLTFALAELVGLLASRERAPWKGDLAEVRQRAETVPEELRSRLAGSDLDRLEILAGFFERWAKSGEERDALLAVAFDERALLRCSLESRLVAVLVPLAAERAGQLAVRFRQLAELLLGELARERRAAVDAQWAAVAEP